ncbi:MAG: formylglycine-generating enzyme family protein [Gammaproteobacteria bacterium]|nr:formylglycine-generating enzyme family protein [Gammaproteobacteria bacterium]
MSWYDAMAYCGWLNHRLQYEIRLPTEWEWQLAATANNPPNLRGGDVGFRLLSSLPIKG